ncbi:hypothetical protein FRC10_007819 [Ceratobasidium sp. 414]|nr:hypothetical protein FRC10_007819 [Ceratobasidium sp. 414]
MALVHGRCAATCITARTAIVEDEPDQICVRAKSVTRIGVMRDNRPEMTVLWSGPSEEIWEQGNTDVVHVSDFAPRYWFVPSGLPELFALFVSYTTTITLSLFFLNLLPIRHLDGAQLLSALLDMYDPNVHLSSFPLSEAQAFAEEGRSNHQYSFTYGTPEHRPQILRRHTSTPSTPPIVVVPNEYGHEQDGWVGTHRKRIEKIAEGTAVGLIVMVAVGNAWVFMG